VAASNNKDHQTKSLHYCLLAPHVNNGVILHAHPVRGESRNQRNTTREVATVHSIACAIDKIDAGKVL